jgi:hypothetical protein
MFAIVFLITGGSPSTAASVAATREVEAQTAWFFGLERAGEKSANR